MIIMAICALHFLRHFEGEIDTINARGRCLTMANWPDGMA
jgi:hypothetical protein